LLGGGSSYGPPSGASALPGGLAPGGLAAAPRIGEATMDQMRARIRSMREPLHIVMVTWRGWTDTDQGFKDYFESHRIPVDLIVLDADRDRDKLADFVTQIHELKPDLVYTWGTSVSMGILGRYDTDTPEAYVTDIPAVFANVSYPVISGLVPSLAGSERMITGSTYLVPLDAQLRAMQSYRPFKTLGIIFNPTESNSIHVVKEMRALGQGDADFVLVERPVPLDDAGLPRADALPDLVAEIAAAGADFLYIPPDSFLSGNKAALTDAAVEAGLPTFAAAEGTLDESHAMMGLISRYYNIGKLTAHLATRIMVGGEDPSSIPIASLARYSLVLNMDVIRDLEFYPPIGLLQISEIKDSRDQPEDALGGRDQMGPYETGPYDDRVPSGGGPR